MRFYDHPTRRYFFTAAIIAILIFVSWGCSGPRAGVYHQVKAGETLYRIAREYNVQPEDIALANNIKDPTTEVKENMVLFIPGGVMKDQTADKKPKAAPASSKEKAVPPPVKNQVGKKTFNATPAKSEKEPEKEATTTKPEKELAPASSSVTKPAGPMPEVKRLFIWPYEGEVTNTFGPQPNGMFFNHIRIEGKEKDPVVAAAAGTVIFSSTLKNFGETVMVKHDGGFTTVYTHLGARTVRKDEQVPQGGKIGFPRPAGKKDRGYIHFEIREHTKPVNPLQFLPPR